MKKTLFFIFIISFLLLSCSTQDKWNSNFGKAIRKTFELGFYTGQKEALKNNYFIKKENDIYIWIGNPWTVDKDYKKNKEAGYNFDLQYIPTMEKEKED
jgi:hypothetical protein